MSGSGLEGITSQITSEETLFRRIPHKCGWHRTEAGQPAWQTFRPTEKDLTEVSLYRAQVVTAEQAAAEGREGNQYYVVELSAGKLIEEGFVLTPKPLADSPGHCELTTVNWPDYQSRKNDLIGLMTILARLCGKLHGPFPGTKSAA